MPHFHPQSRGPVHVLINTGSIVVGAHPEVVLVEELEDMTFHLCTMTGELAPEEGD